MARSAALRRWQYGGASCQSMFCSSRKSLSAFDASLSRRCSFGDSPAFLSLASMLVFGCFVVACLHRLCQNHIAVIIVDYEDIFVALR